MALTRAETPVTWPSPGITVKDVLTVSGETSDIMTLDTTCVSASITCKVINSDTSPVSGDTIEFYVLASSGDADSTGGDDYPTDENDAQFLCMLDTFAGTSTMVRTVNFPVVPQNFKIYAYNNGASTTEVSATIEELRAA
jgi:hypothetical protein